MSEYHGLILSPFLIYPLDSYPDSLECGIPFLEETELTNSPQKQFPESHGTLSTASWHHRQQDSEHDHNSESEEHAVVMFDALS
jgi:hypothetical protein